MNRAQLDLTYLAAIAAAMVLTGCTVDNKLGDVDTDGGSSGTDGTESASSRGPTSASTSNGSVSTSDGPTSSTTESSSTTTTTDATGTTAGEPSECARWSPPPFDCEPPGSAHADVYPDQGSWLPNLTDEPCTVDSVQSVDPDTDLVTLTCDDTYAFEITTADPHLELPISGGENVLLTSVESFEPAISGLSSFVIRSSQGDLLIARVNELDLTPDVSVDPVVFTPTPSGCPGSGGAVICDDPSHTILTQRMAVEFGNGIVPTVVFPGNHAVVQAGNGQADAIVNGAHRIVCWDDSCAGDDSGPFDILDLLIIVQPSG